MKQPQPTLAAAEETQAQLGVNIVVGLPADAQDIGKVKIPASGNGKKSRQGHISSSMVPTDRNADAQIHLTGSPSYQTPYSGSRSYNYEEKYAPDPLGDEIKENARVWKVYLDEAESYDNEMVQGFKDSIDSLLVFAALFSGVVTSFVITAVGSLQPNYGQITATLLMEQVRLLRAAGNVTEINAISPSNVISETAAPGLNDLWINGLFFTSLSLSLTTALLSVLVKQWLQAYGAMSSGNARERALIHQFRFSGLRKWKVPEIIGVLPLILHASLALFFVGLSLYVAELHSSLCWIIVAITAVAFTIYLGSIFIPQIWLQCPYRIPLLFVPTKIILHPFRIAKWICFKILHALPLIAERLDLDITQPAFSNQTLEKLESEYLNSSYITDHVLANIVVWLHTLQSNQSIQRIVGQSLHGILKTDKSSLYRYKEVLAPHLSSISEIIWFSLKDLDENDTYGCEIWTSTIRMWMKRTSLSYYYWPRMDVEVARKSLENSIRSNNQLALKLIIELSRCTYSTLGSIHGLYPTALHDAAMHGHLEVCEMLVENGENVNVQGGLFGTALQAAASSYNSLAVVKSLVQRGAYVNAHGGKYGTALQAAATQSLDSVKFLVENGANVNVQGGAYETALQAAARFGNLDIVKFLIENGADVNIQGGGYETALQAAVRFRHLDIARFLMEKGADNHQENLYLAS